MKHLMKFNEQVTLKYLKGILDDKDYAIIKKHDKRDLIFKEINSELKSGKVSDNEISAIVDRAFKKLKLKKKLNESLVSCSGCGAKIEEENAPSPFLCNDCEEKGWWIDPAGGVHEPSEEDEDDFEDPASMYA